MQIKYAVIWQHIIILDIECDIIRDDSYSTIAYNTTLSYLNHANIVCNTGYCLSTNTTNATFTCDVNKTDHSVGYWTNKEKCHGNLQTTISILL